jgi:hypothetical protein
MLLFRFSYSVIIIISLYFGYDWNYCCRFPPDRYNKMDLRVKRIFVYPIKSCGAFETNEWQLESYGFLYDRNWVVVSDTGVCMTQLEEPKLCLIRPYVDLQKGTMSLLYAGKLIPHQWSVILYILPRLKIRPRRSFSDTVIIIMVPWSEGWCAAACGFDRNRDFEHNNSGNIVMWN